MAAEPVGVAGNGHPYTPAREGGKKIVGSRRISRKLPTEVDTNRNYFFAGALEFLAGALEVESEAAGAAVFFLTCFLCFFTVGVLGWAGALVLGVWEFWAARDRAAASAVPNIKVVKRFIVVFLFRAFFSLPSLHKTRPQINQALNAS